MKQSNEKHLNKGNMIQISYYDTLEGVDEDIRIRLNEKIEEIRQQA